MATMEHPLTLLPSASPQTNQWCLLVLEHLEEFATLAWYLVADGNLVEEVFSRTLAQLDATPFDDSVPLLAYNQARNTVITEAIAALAEIRKKEEANQVTELFAGGEPPDLSRLAFMLRLVIRFSESEVAHLLHVTSSEVKELVVDAIRHISTFAHCSMTARCSEA